MPQRLTQIRKFDASAVQGEGAYVEFRTFTWGELRKLQGRVTGVDPTSGSDVLIGETEDMIVSNLVGWNWADAAGAPLPLPKSGADLETLTTDEMLFLAERVRDLAKSKESSESGALKN